MPMSAYEDMGVEGINVPATCSCISGTNLLRQLYVLAHCDKKLLIKLAIPPSHSILTSGQLVLVLTR